MATFDDAKAGWEIFRAANFSLTREEINRRLIVRGFAPISKRTFQHYRKLRRYGYYEYVPINQLDVKTLKDPLWDQAVRSRYPVYDKPVPIKLETVFGGRFLSLPGYTIDLSPASVTCRLDTDVAGNLFQDDSFHHHLRTQRITVHFFLSGQRYIAQVEQVTHHLSEGIVSVSLRFVSLAPIELVTERSLLPIGTIRVRFKPHFNAALLSDTVRLLYWLFQALETSRVVCEELLHDLRLERVYTMPSARIRKLKMESPLEIFVSIAAPAVSLMLFLVQARKKYHEGSINREVARRLKLENDLLEQSAEFVKTQIIRYVHRSRGEKIELSPEEDTLTRWKDVAMKQLLPSLDQLLDDTVGDVDIDFELQDDEITGDE